jgi:HK97 gp10 family phage protein
MELKIKIQNLDETLKKFGKLKDELKEPFREVVKGGAQLIRGEAIKSIQTGAKSGIVYEKYNPRRTHKSSAPGQPPASDTGNLVRNIRVKQKDKDNVEVQSNAPYSAFLEFGTSKMLPRPFLFPAFEKSKFKITEAVSNKIKQKIKELTK